jgi:hypothetical protein
MGTPFDHRRADEELIAERYLRGELPAEKAARFEEHYLDCAHCLERLEAARRLHLGIRGVAAEEAGRQAAAAGLGLLAALARLRRSRQLLLAVACVALALLPAGLLAPRLARLGRERDRLAAEVSQLREPRINTPVLRLAPLRSGAAGGGPAHRLTLSHEPEWVVLALVPGEPDAGPYRAELVGPGGDRLWQGSGLVPDATGALVLTFGSERLGEGDHRLRIEPEAGAGEPATFAFRVARPAGPGRPARRP